MFGQLVLARIIEPVSLPVDAKDSWRKQIPAACTAQPGLGSASLVLHDVSALYFETDAGDGFREPGISEERRLGAADRRPGRVPFMLSAFEGNRAETDKTMLPAIEAFMTARQFPDVTIVTDASLDAGLANCSSAPTSPNWTICAASRSRSTRPSAAPSRRSVAPRGITHHRGTHAA